MRRNKKKFVVLLLTLNGQFSCDGFLTADHVGCHTLIISFVDRLHIINQQIAAINDTNAIVATSNVIQVDPNVVLDEKFSG